MYKEQVGRSLKAPETLDLSFLKILVKYFAVLMLLLVGYMQAFAHLHREDFDSLTHEKKSYHLQAPVAKTTEISSSYFEEESKRNLLKPYSKDNTFSELFYEHVTAEQFFQRFTRVAAFGDEFSHRSSLLPPLFRVLRI